MTKVKILSSGYADILERMVSELMSTHYVTKIQFSTAGTAHTVIYSAMITYEED